MEVNQPLGGGNGIRVSKIYIKYFLKNSKEKIIITQSNNGKAKSTTSAFVIPSVNKIETKNEYMESAIEFLQSGFPVIPIINGEKKPALKWDPWLEGLNESRIRNHWSKYPKHELGFIVPENILVLDCDGPESLAALNALEADFEISSNFVVETKRGQHRYYRLKSNVRVKSDSHKTEDHPERIDVKARRTMVVLPPSTGKVMLADKITAVMELVEVDQTFVDAVFKHNGRESPSKPALNIRLVEDKVATEETLFQLNAMLEALDPDCGRDDWRNVGMAIHYETGGCDVGYTLWQAWSEKGKKYPGDAELSYQWSTFDSDVSNPVTIASIRRMVFEAGYDADELCMSPEDRFQAVTVDAVQEENLLRKYSLAGDLAELEKNTLASVPLLGNIVLQGQWTAIFAAPNTGKTLIVLSLIMDGIEKGRINPDQLYYLNMDDSGEGLVTKLGFAEEYGFHMLAEGHHGFKATDFLEILLQLIQKNQCSGVIVVLDTLKKFVDVIDKKRVRDFTAAIRSFVMHGGTLISLGHVNKNLNAQGKPVFGGVSDFKDDADCVYMLYTLDESVPDHKVVMFENDKLRGNVDLKVAYRYARVNGLPYSELVASVEKVDEHEVGKLLTEVEQKSDSDVICAILEGIRSGINTKMKLGKLVAGSAGVSERAALRIIEKYTGTDTAIHQWKFEREGHGAHKYSILG